MRMESPTRLKKFGPTAQGPDVTELFPHIILERASGKGSVHLIINSIFAIALLGS